LKPALCVILLTSLVIGALSPVFAQTSSGNLRCDGGVVTVGDYASELLRKCGEPVYATQREQKILEEGSLTGDRIITTIIIDDWTFNFGPNRFQCRILLRNGRIWKIETMDYYGY
jgi:Protein of unknown function (DUF2845).